MVNLGMWPWAGRPVFSVHCSQSASWPSWHAYTPLLPPQHFPYLCVFSQAPGPPLWASSLSLTYLCVPTSHTIYQQLSAVQLELDAWWWCVSQQGKGLLCRDKDQSSNIKSSCLSTLRASRRQDSHCHRESSNGVEPEQTETLGG